MTATVREWLPDNALSPDRLAAALDDVLSTWATASFPATRAECVACGDGQKPVAGDLVVVDGKQARVAISGTGKRILLEAALEVSLDAVTLSERDHLALDKLANGLLERLRDLLDDALEPTPADATSIRLQLSLAGKAIGEVRMARTAVIPLLKNRLPVRSSEAKPLSRRMEGIARLKVRVEGVLGSIALTVEDARDLAIGDVLIVDSKLAETVGLRIADSKLAETVGLRIADNAAAFARGRLEPEDGHNRLRMMFS
jgi:flagellar motor switch/type III secretory pathway protein FliN